MSRPADTPAVLRIPADPANVATVRIFAGAIGRHAGLDEEGVDDLKLALSEVAAEMIGDGAAPDVEIVIEAETGPVGCRLRCRGPAGTPDGASDDRRRLLHAIAPDLSWTREGEELRATFSVGG